MKPSSFVTDSGLKPAGDVMANSVRETVWRSTQGNPMNARKRLMAIYRTLPPIEGED